MEQAKKERLLSRIGRSLAKHSAKDYEKFYEASKTLTNKLQNEILNGRIPEDVGLTIWSVLDTVVDVVKYTPDSEVT